MVEERGGRADILTEAERPTIASESFGGVEDLAALGDAQRYELGGLLGEGGMGEVRLCTDRHVGRQVAMKLMRKDSPVGPEMRARFLHEARVQGQTEHPSIVPVYDIGTDEAGSLYFTMRRVEGKTLEDILAGLRNKIPSFEQAYSRHKLLTAFGSACLAVHFAHTRAVFHCDLKPANVMLGAFGEMYVLDWGLATRASRHPDAAAAAEDARGTVSGTPGYMSPEQIRGEAVDAASDVYALGALLYEILTLNPMHPGTNPRDLCMKTLQGDIERPSYRAPDRDIPPELEAICMKATMHGRTRRYASARDLYDDLERYLEGDRDLSMRRAMSREHASRAVSLAERASKGGPESTAARSDALRAVGRALALDPDNADALRTLVQLITQPPPDMPPEAIEEMRGAERAVDRARSRAAMVGIVAAAVVLPLNCAFTGIRDMSMLVVSAVAGLTAALASVLRVRVPRHDGYAPTYIVLAVALALASWGVCFSPQLFIPTLSIPLAMGYTLSMDRGRRFLPMLATGLALALPLFLERLHLTPPSQVSVGSLLCAVPRMSGFPAPGSAILTVANLGVLISCCYFAVRSREALTDMQRRVSLTAWQLRQLLPREAGPATMPPPAP